MTTALCFRQAADFVSLELVPAFSETDGDAYLAVQVSSKGYCGKNDLWVEGEALRSFCAELVVLNRSLVGVARLQSISPGELDVVVQSVSSRGNVAVSGSTGYFVQRDNSRWWHAVTFGFEFEQGQLQAAIGASWLREYAA
jgi:hypothetical protein